MNAAFVAKRKKMSRELIMSKILKLAREIAQDMCIDPETIKPETDFIDAGLDSMALLELLAACEKNFQVNIPDTEFFSLRSVQAFSEAVWKHRY